MEALSNCCQKFN